MHHLKLHRAIDPDGQSVLATDAFYQNEDTFLCPSCGCTLILQIHSRENAWFEHDEREFAETSRYCIHLANTDLQVG